MRRQVAIVVLAVTVVMLAACDTDTDSTGDDTTPAPTDAVTEARTEASDPEALRRVADAAAATAEEGTVRFDVTVATEGTAGEDGPQPVSAEGEEDFTAEQRRVIFHGPGGDLEAIVDETDIYIQVPGTEDDTWARVELEKLIAGDTGFGGPAGLPFRSSRDNLLLLQDSVTSAVASGEEDVGGEPTTRYDLVVDLERAAQNAAESNDTAAALAKESGITELDVQVWVDEEDLIRRVAYSLDMSQADVEAATEGVEADVESGGVVTVALEYFDFGTDVTIDVPSEDAIVDLDEDEIRNSVTVPSGDGPTDTGS